MATVKYGALDLVPAPQLGLSVESNFFGADIRFSKKKVYSLRGTLINSTLDGASGIYSAQNQLITGFVESYLPFSINGMLVGYPKINSIAFDNGPLVRTNGYAIELEILESGNPFQITGAEYGFTSVTGMFYNVESVNETLSYDTDFRTSNHTHSVSVVYRSGFNIDPLLNAKLIASGLINNKSAFPFITTGGPFGIKTYEERINTFGGEYSVTEKFVGTTGSLAYDHYFSLQIALDTNGIATVSENGTVKGYDPSKYINAKSGYAIATQGIFNNCSNLYSEYLSGSLNNTYLSDTRIDDVNAGLITYSRSFTDETGVSTFRWTYTQTLTLEDNYARTNENGSIVGLGHITTRFSTASGAWNTIRPGIPQRLGEQYSGYGLTGTLYNVGRSQTFDRFDGKIDYDYDFSNRNVYDIGSGIRSLETTITEQEPTHAVANFNIINAGVIVQSVVATKPGQRNVNADIIAFRETAKTGLCQFATNILNKYRPTGAIYIDPFLSKLSVSYGPLVNTLTADATYNYGGYREISGLDV